MTETKTPASSVNTKWLVWIILAISAIPLIALNPWWHRRPGQTIGDVNAVMLALLLFVVLPITVITVPIVRYGRRHGWGRLQYAWVELGGGIGWYVVLMWLAWRAGVRWVQMDRVLLFAAMLGVPCALILIGQMRAQRSKSSLHLGWLAASVGTFALLLWLAGHT